MKIFTSKEVCKILNIPYYRLVYLFQAGKIEDVKRISSNQRIFTMKDVIQIRKTLNR